MRILTYKRTHVGDPDKYGYFGIKDCMGRVRGYGYDAVIGVGGSGWEPKFHGIDKKITWVGIWPNRRYKVVGRRAAVITFKHFVLFDSDGPLLEKFAPKLAKRIYGGPRYILNAYSATEKAEAISIIAWAFTFPHFYISGSGKNNTKRQVCKANRKSYCKKLPTIHS